MIRTKSKQNKPFFQKIKSFIWIVTKWFLIISILSVLLFKWIPVPFTPLMISRTIAQKIEGKTIICKHTWTPIDSMSTNLQKAVISSEDGTFLEHNGFDFKAMKLAYKNNSKGKKMKGGSTISQQTAKNVFLWQGRSYVRKIFEAYFTFLIEVFWGKKRIMEVYLNSIEMGDGIYGAEAATQFWYHKNCKSLTLQEAAGIAAILPNPRNYKATNSSTYINSQKNKIVKRIKNIGKLDY